ncbi:MAG: HD-GYP domain-containing protein [Gammaproteobacteria bacterium]|nr:HD-GYP domain-containing protein [Gammaproteobacteria bacterium]
MPVKEVKTSIEGLEIGMFVAHLDRPWIETSYMMEGMLIQSEDDIIELSKYCSYVYIDVEQGLTPKARYWAVGNEDEMTLSSKKTKESSVITEDTDYSRYRQCVYETSTELKEELKTAHVIFDDISETTETVFEDLKSGKNLDIVSLKKGIKATVDSIIRNPSAFLLLMQLKKSDNYSYSHALGVSVWCAQFGRHLGLKQEDINVLALGGMLLDVGKVKLSEELVHKTTQYTPEDFEEHKHHVAYGVKMLTESRKLERSILEMVATHHERANGVGYQLGISNKRIPLFGRIAGIVDSYDAMTTKKSHTDKTLSPHEAINELYNMRGKQFQVELVEQFIQTVGLYPTGSLIELNTGEVGVVVEINDLKRLYPTVVLLLDKDKQPYEEFNTVDLSKVSGMKVKDGLEPGAYGIKMDELFL